MERVQKFFKKISLGISAVSISLMVCLITFENILRLFKRSTLISDEYAGYLMVLIVYSGAVASFSEGKFVRVEALYEIFSKKVRYWIDVLFKVILIAYTLTLSIFVWRRNWSNFLFDSRSYSVAQTPLYIPQFFMSLGLFMFDVYLLMELLQILKKRGE